MKILFLTPRIPYPPHKGDQAVAFHRLRTLGLKHEITLLTFVEGQEDPRAELALRPFCRRIIRVPHPRWKIIWNLVTGGLFNELPLQANYYRSAAFRTQLDTLLNDNFDVIHAFMLRLLPYLEEMKVPVVLECIDSMQLNLSRQVQLTSGPMRWIYQEEFRRISSYENSIDEYVERALFVSDIDAKASGSNKALVLPLGVTPPSGSARCEQPIVAFSGNMGYDPNIQAVEWFIRNCWEKIYRTIPDASFWIIGGNPPPSIVSFQKLPGVRVVGQVENMMRELMQVAVSVAPMQSGSGMQFKILEAMACGLPVVTTQLGLGAIAAEPNENIVIADEPADMIIAIINLLNNPETRKRIGANAQEFVKDHHSWENAAMAIESEWSDLVL